MTDFSSKQGLRNYIKLQKKQYASAQFWSWSVLVCEQIRSLSVYSSARTVLLYNALPDEVNLDLLLNDKSRQILLPVVWEDRLLIRKSDENTNFSSGSLGILEPLGEDYMDIESIDLIIVPGMAFDEKLNRMGRGKGYYDKFLARNKAVKVGVCFDFQLMPDVPVDSYDIPMDILITPSKQYFR